MSRFVESRRRLVVLDLDDMAPGAPFGSAPPATRVASVSGEQAVAEGHLAPFGGAAGGRVGALGAGPAAAVVTSPSARHAFAGFHAASPRSSGGVSSTLAGTAPTLLPAPVVALCDMPGTVVVLLSSRSRDHVSAVCGGANAVLVAEHGCFLRYVCLL